MQKFRKKPVEIEAIQWDGSKERAQEINQWNGMQYWRITDDQELVIPTLEGAMTAHKDDWIIKGIKGEFYPCKPNIFEETYRPVEGDETDVTQCLVCKTELIPTTVIYKGKEIHALKCPKCNDDYTTLINAKGVLPSEKNSGGVA